MWWRCLVPARCTCRTSRPLSQTAADRSKPERHRRNKTCSRCFPSELCGSNGPKGRFLALHLSVESVALGTLGEPPDDVLEAVHGRLDLRRVVSCVRLSVLKDTRTRTSARHPEAAERFSKKKKKKKISGRITDQSEAFLGLSESGVGSQHDALVEVSHRLVHLVQQDLQLRGKIDFRPTHQDSVLDASGHHLCNLFTFSS